MANERRQAKRARSDEARKARQRAAKRKRFLKIGAVVGALAIVSSGLAFLGASGANPNCPDGDGTSSRKIKFDNPIPDCINENDNYAATFETSEGKIVVDLNTENTPKTTSNFVSLARYKYYDGTDIFRTDKSIDIVQGGSPTTNDGSDPGPGYRIEDEGNGYKYTEGDLVMARTDEPNSAGAQFFFATGPKVSNLDAQGTYVKFGKVREGMDVLKKIIELGPDGNGAPSKRVTVNSVTIQQT